MLDWLTLSLPYTAMPAGLADQVMRMGDRIARYCARTGALRWESSAWDSVRSDSHQVACRAGSDALHLQGSPARALGDGDAVFGVPGAGAAEGARAMIRHVSRALEILLPADLSSWKCSRMDCTVHLELPDLAAVRVALSILRGVEGGRYRVSQVSGDTVYWSQRSRLRAGKAYAKGPHLVYMTKQNGYSGYSYSREQLASANRLLRLELRLASQYWRERADKAWYLWTFDDIESAAWSYFERMLGDANMNDVSDIETAVRRVVSDDGQLISDGSARTALGTWGLICSFGWERARTMVSKTSWYRHLKVLHAAGLSDADISAGRVVELRTVRLCDARRVSTWSDLRSVA